MSPTNEQKCDQAIAAVRATYPGNRIPPEVKTAVHNAVKVAYETWYCWQPFDTAPKDREILVTFPNQGFVVLLISYNNIHKYWQIKGEPHLGLEGQGCFWTDIPKPLIK